VERAADSTLQQWNRLLERQLAERTQELGRSLVDVRSFDLNPALGARPAGTEGVLSSKMGLLTIQERMKVLNGRFDLASAPKQGTTATLTVPIGPRTSQFSLHER
jgi:hypothetical protein